MDATLTQLLQEVIDLHMAVARLKDENGKLQAIINLMRPVAKTQEN